MRILAGLAFALGCLFATVPTLAQEESKISRTDRGHIRDTKETLSKLAKDLRVHEQMHDKYPAELKGLVDNQIRESLPKDAWGHEFLYELSPETGFKLTSLGSDGKKGGQDAAADIVWTNDGELRVLTADEKARLEKQRDEATFQAHRAVALREMVVVGTAAVGHRREKAAWPAALKEVRPTSTDTDEAKSIDRCFTDPWGSAYVLKLLAHENFAIICYGADGKEGGKERDADFVITEKEVRPNYVQRNRWDRWGGRGGNWDWQANELVESIKRFKKLVNRLPDDLAELMRPGLTKDGNPIRQNIPKDRHGAEYVYVKYGEDEFFVIGLGKDGIQGGTGDDADSVTPEPGVVEREYEEFEPPQEDQDALRVEVAREQALDIADKLIAYHAENSKYPESLETIKDKFPGETVPVDPWNNGFVYALTKNEKEEVTGFSVTCYGSDGAIGGTENSADIVVNEKKEAK